MDSVDLQVLKNAVSWLGEGHGVTLVTVVKTWGSSPRPAGAMLAIRDDGQISGSVSGGCVEDDLIERIRRREIAKDKPEVTTYGVTREQAQRFGLPCGGTLQLVLEPLTDLDFLKALLAAIERRELISRTLDLATGEVSLLEAAPGDILKFNGESLTTIHGPSWRMLIIGAGQTSRYLAQMAQALDYNVIVCDPREEYADSWDIPGVAVDRRMPDDVVTALELDSHSVVIALTHDPKLDDMALLEALKSAAFYVGALGSKVNNDKRRERLAQYFDLSSEELSRLHGPVGLRLGSRTPPEIAVAILAELTALRHGVELAVVADEQREPLPVITQSCD